VVESCLFCQERVVEEARHAPLVFPRARVLRDRRTNPEIASALFLSEKTIETHMRNIFRKLDVSSRAEVARTVERAGRVA
jgi:hypothetical protein